MLMLNQLSPFSCTPAPTAVQQTSAVADLQHLLEMLKAVARVAGVSRQPCVSSSSSRHMVQLAPSRRGVGTSSATSSGADQGSTAGSIEQMSVKELQELLSNPMLCEEVQFVDVREQWEFDTAKLPRFQLFPLSQASSWAATIDTQLDPDTETVVLCHHGMRSMQMAGFLVSKGFKTVKNVSGGIAAYSMVDRNVPEY